MKTYSLNAELSNRDSLRAFKEISEFINQSNSRELVGAWIRGNIEFDKREIGRGSCGISQLKRVGGSDPPG